MSWAYSDEVKRHFLHPKNFLEGDESDFRFNAKGRSGNMRCGDEMVFWLWIEDGRIVDLRWQTFGCASAIASTSVLSEMAKGKTLEQAGKISAKDIENALAGLPKQKIHCSVLGDQALKDAIADYKSRS